jgi:transposase
MRAERLENEPEALQRFVGTEPVRAVMEAGRCWGWFYDMLSQMCDDVKLAHPLKVRAIASAKIKNDRIDSKVLTQLLAADLIPEAYARRVDNRRDLAVLRQRAFWVKTRTRIKNRIHELVDRQGLAGRPDCSDLFGKTGLEWLRAVPLAASERELLDEMLEGLAFVSERVAASDRRVRRMYKSDPVAQRISTIPGFGEFFSVLISKEIDDIRRFPSPEKLHAYAGIIPSTYASGGSVRHGHMTLQGNRWLRWAAVEAAIPATRGNAQFRALYEKHKRKRGNAKIAKVVVAKRLLTIAYRLWSQERDFEPYKKAVREIEPPCAPYDGASGPRPPVG